MVLSEPCKENNFAHLSKTAEDNTGWYVCFQITECAKLSWKGTERCQKTLQ